MENPKMVVDYTYSNGNTADCITGTITTGNTWEDAWYKGISFQSPLTVTLDTTIKENNMRGLFIVYVVNGVKGEVVWTTVPFVADNAEKAKMKAAQEGTKGLDLDDLDFVVLRLGDVRPKERVKEIKVVS